MLLDEVFWAQAESHGLNDLRSPHGVVPAGKPVERPVRRVVRGCQSPPAVRTFLRDVSKFLLKPPALLLLPCRCELFDGPTDRLSITAGRHRSCCSVAITSLPKGGRMALPAFALGMRSDCSGRQVWVIPTLFGARSARVR
jgi:hypothetical protein